MFSRIPLKNRLTETLLNSAAVALAVTLTIGVPLYQRWLSANLLTFVMPNGLHIRAAAAEFLLCWALWFLFWFFGGKACARIYALFSVFEFLPVLWLQTPSGLYEFSCLLLFPAAWTALAWTLSASFRGVKRLLQALLSAALTAGFVQYIMYGVYILRYGRRLGYTTMMTMLGTNMTEARSFLADQFGLWQTLASFGLLFALMALFRFMVRQCRPVGRILAGIVLTVFFCGAGFVCHQYAPSYRNLFLDFHKGYQQYQTALDSLSWAHSDPGRRIEDLQVSKSGKGEISVIVVGESASRDHMKPWGYRRDTTPWMTAAAASSDPGRDGKTVLLKNAYSGMVHTEPAVTLALSQFNNYDPRLLLWIDRKDDSFMYRSAMSAYSIFEMLGAAGITTHWLSNQDKIGAYSNLITAQARTADEQYFLEDTFFQRGRSWHLDEELLTPLKDILSRARGGENHAVFIHLRGSHWSYKNGAPESWPWLPEDPEVQKLPPEAAAKINAYDRSLTYTDSVLKRICGLLQESGFEVSSMVYFSDHGEDVTGMGHNFDAFRPVMARIPVMMWFSPGYQARYPGVVAQVEANADKIFTNDLICPLVLGLFQVRYGNHRPEQDLTSDRYAVTSANARFWTGRPLTSLIPDLAQETGQ